MQVEHEWIQILRIFGHGEKGLTLLCLPLNIQWVRLSLGKTRILFSWTNHVHEVYIMYHSFSLLYILHRLWVWFPLYIDPDPDISSQQNLSVDYTHNRQLRTKCAYNWYHDASKKYQQEWWGHDCVLYFFRVQYYRGMCSELVWNHNRSAERPLTRALASWSTSGVASTAAFPNRRVDVCHEIESHTSGPRAKPLCCRESEVDGLNGPSNSVN